MILVIFISLVFWSTQWLSPDRAPMSSLANRPRFPLQHNLREEIASLRAEVAQFSRGSRYPSHSRSRSSSETRGRSSSFQRSGHCFHHRRFGSAAVTVSLHLLFGKRQRQPVAPPPPSPPPSAACCTERTPSPTIASWWTLVLN